MPSEQRPDAGQRLLGMLSAGAGPLPYRGGVYRLLGIAPRAGARMATPPPLPPVALQYQSNAWPQPSPSPFGMAPSAPTAPPRPPTTLGTARPVVASADASPAPAGSAVGAGAENTSPVSPPPSPPATKVIELPGRTDTRGGVRTSGTASTPEVRRSPPAERIPSAAERAANRTENLAPAPSVGASPHAAGPGAAAMPGRIRVSGNFPSFEAPEEPQSGLSSARADRSPAQRASEGAGRPTETGAPSAAGPLAPGSSDPATPPPVSRTPARRGAPVASSTTPAPRATAGARVETEPHRSLEPAGRVSTRIPPRASDRTIGEAAGAQADPQSTDAPAPVDTAGLAIPGTTRRSAAPPSPAAGTARSGAPRVRSASPAPVAASASSPTLAAPSGTNGGLLRALAPARPRDAAETPQLRSNARALEQVEALRGAAARRADRPAPAAAEPARTEPPREAPRPAEAPAPVAPRILVVRPEPAPVRVTSRSFWSASTLRGVHFRVLR